jgi:ABC-type branched-subunit amino acid transport system substrate-binding protein
LSDHSCPGIVPAAFTAIDAVNADPTVMKNHNLKLINQDGQCRPDIVMRTFINYYLKQEKIIGVLGPACSESVEPIAGVSKHFRMTVISYSAEGASFSDREAYPYFFRTIGENRQ